MKQSVQATAAVSWAWSHHRSAGLAVGKKSWCPSIQDSEKLKEELWQGLISCRSGHHPCQQGEPVDQWQCAWAAAMPGTQHQLPSITKQLMLPLPSKSHGNVSWSVLTWNHTREGVSSSFIAQSKHNKNNRLQWFLISGYFASPG